MRFFSLTSLTILAALCTSPAGAVDKFERYNEPNISTLTDYVFDAGMVKIEDNKEILEYLQFKDCTLFNIAKDDLFKQQQIAEQMKKGQADRSKNFNRNLYVKFPASFNVTKYNFTTQSFDLSDDTKMKNVGLMTILEDHGNNCGGYESAPQKFPNIFTVKLNYPITVSRLPLQPNTAKSIFNKLDKNISNNKQKKLYAMMYISIEGTTTNIATDIRGHTATLLGQVDAIDVYTDEARTQRIKRLDYSSTH